MTVSFATIRRTHRNTSLFCPVSCPSYLGPTIHNKYKSTINNTYSRLARPHSRRLLGGKPSWSFPVKDKPFGLANPPDYDKKILINQYGRLVTTGGTPLRNF